MPALLPAGTVLRSRYKVIEFISQGGMGAIYRAEDLRLEGRMCAVKEMWTDIDSTSQDAEQVQIQFHREASVLARLDHPNLPKVSDYFAEDQRDYLVMDFVAGSDLKQLMDAARQNGRFLPEAQVLDWARQILDAIEYLHTQHPPVLHRDIKPANIKLSPSGTIKLVDFGLVKLMVPDEDRTVTVLQGRGTAQYTPLEQYGGDTGHTNVRSDIYSLGATLYHLLTNHPPADAKSRYLQPDVLQAPSAYNPDISPRVEQAILHAIAMHPSERPADVGAFREELLSSQPLEPLVDKVLHRTARRWGHALRANVLLLVLVLVLLVAALVATLLSPYLPPALITQALF
ncbi:MAG: serine/threonine protein kinase [Anaerolineae bacterium]|nr:serine/threonine protein kinase [Anaerolineae bacterium]